MYAAWSPWKSSVAGFFFSPSNKIISVQIEPHLAGLVSVDELNNEEMIKHWGHFTRIDPPRRLAFTLNVPKHFHGEARIAVDIAKTAEGCRLTLTQSVVGLETPSGYGKACSTASPTFCKAGRRSSDYKVLAIPGRPVATTL